MVGFKHSEIPYANKTPMQKARALAKMPADITSLAHERTLMDWALYSRLRERAARSYRRKILTQGLPAPQPSTTFCFMVIRPNSYEVQLLQTAFKDGGFPACTEFRVYSNVSSVAPNIPAIPAVEGSMDVKNGGEYMCAL